MPSLPKILLVGGPDVDARLDLMEFLRDTFSMSALGTVASLEEKFTAKGFEYYPYNLNRKVSPFQDLVTFIQLVRIFRRLRPKIVHSFDVKPGVWARLAARLSGVPVVIGTLPGLGSLYTSNNFLSKLVRPIYQMLQTMACRFSDLTIFQNMDDAQQFINAGVVPARKALVIPGSGVNTNEFSQQHIPENRLVEMKDELGLQPDQLVVTMVSRVIRSKGVMEFMEVALQIKKDYPDICFLLIGQEDHESLDHLTAKEIFKLKQAMNWPGPKEDIPAVLALSDVFVLPTAYREGIPRVLLEAASMGVPIVTTDMPGCKDVVENDINGFLVPVGDTTALKNAILRLIRNPELRQQFGQSSRQKAVEQYEISVISRQTQNLYKHLLNGQELQTLAMAKKDLFIEN